MNSGVVDGALVETCAPRERTAVAPGVTTVVTCAPSLRTRLISAFTSLPCYVQDSSNRNGKAACASANSRFHPNQRHSALTRQNRGINEGEAERWL